ncbi:MAG: DUF4129 domain-containing protein [Candidatus Limnocylindria bacterium]
MRWSSRAERLIGGLLPILALVAEGAWLTVVYVAVETAIDIREPLLGTFEFTVVAGIAALAVRRGWLHPDEDVIAFLVAVVAAGMVGWLWDAQARELVLAGNVVDAVLHHPGGWLTIAAFMRGIGRGLEVDDRALTRLVLIGVPALSLPWILGQFAQPELRSIFTEEAFVASVTFVSAGFMAAGLARLQEIGRETGIDWRRNRSWLGMVLGVLLVVLAIGIPAAYLLGLPVDTVARGILGPVLTLLGYLFLGIAIVAGVLATALYSLLSSLGLRLPAPRTPGEAGELPVIQEYTLEQLEGPLVTVAIFWALTAILAVIVARIWLRRRQRRARGRTDEERSFRLPQTSLRLELPRLRVPRRRRATMPSDAVGAYLATLEDLADHADGQLGRLEHETPRSHARRVAPAAGVELGALQADYALARYAGRRLSRAEDRRAVGRWHRLRARLGDR